MDCQVKIFNIDDPLHCSNLSLRWYKKILLTFTNIIYCLPLSWFQLLRRTYHSEKSNWINDNRIKSIHKRFIDLTKFHANTIEYDHKRFNTLYNN